MENNEMSNCVDNDNLRVWIFQCLLTISQLYVNPFTAIMFHTPTAPPLVCPEYPRIQYLFICLFTQRRKLRERYKRDTRGPWSEIVEA